MKIVVCTAAADDGVGDVVCTDDARHRSGLALQGELATGIFDERDPLVVEGLESRWSNSVHESLYSSLEKKKSNMRYKRKKKKKIIQDIHQSIAPFPLQLHRGTLTLMHATLLETPFSLRGRS